MAADTTLKASREAKPRPLRRREQRSAEAKEYRKLYHTAAWLKRRKAQLDAEPLCQYCARQGRVTAANVADHRDPHRGDPVKFFKGPLQSLCTECHDSAKQSEERNGRVTGCDQSGSPADPNHLWNAPCQTSQEGPGRPIGNLPSQGSHRTCPKAPAIA